ncbi:MAG: immunoglobulin domain-containing protein [Verrucomicrobia bacterium]|nr:immunoglobulin domain-containing protein [Verrucomicrobiota bacterium]
MLARTMLFQSPVASGLLLGCRTGRWPVAPGQRPGPQSKSGGRLVLLRSPLALAALASASLLPAQTPETVAVTKKFSYEQTAAATLSVFKPSLEVSVRFPGDISSATSVTLTTPGTTMSLARSSSSSPGTTTFAGTQTFADHAALNAAASAGTYTLAVSGGGSNFSTSFPSYYDNNWAVPRFTNYDSLQSWAGGQLQILWQPIPDTATGDDVNFTLSRANGSIFYATPSGSLSSSATSFSFTFPSSPGDLYHGTLSSTRLYTSVTAANSMRVSFYKKFEVRTSVQRPTPSPVILQQPASKTVDEGRSTIIAVSDSSINATYVWKKDGVVITSATTGFRLLQSQLLIENARRSDAGAYTVTITNAGGSVTSSPATLTVIPNLRPAAFSSWPLTPRTVRIGENYSTSAQVLSNTPVTFQWYRNGTLIKTTVSNLGVNGYYHSDTLSLAPVKESDLGVYAVTISNSAGGDISPDFVLAVERTCRITNLSILTALASPGETFTIGYVVGGHLTRNGTSLVIRAAGPSLRIFGLTNPVDDPKIELFVGTNRKGENDNWGGTTRLANAFSSVGAFPFSSPLSTDAAYLDYTAGSNSVRISSADGGIGSVLAEIYDATANVNSTATTPRLVNVSVLKPVGNGLTAGFVLGGSGTTTVLVRAIGPTLGAAPFNVPGVVSDPQLTLFGANSTRLGGNDNWGGTPELASAFSQVGAFALPADSRDAALLVTLAPGSYTAQVSGVAGTTGIALVEVYEVP